MSSAFLKFCIATMPKHFSMIRRMSSTSTEVKKLAGRVALVSASTEGIGFAIAKRLAEDGCSVMINSRQEDKVQRALKELHGSGLTSVSGVPGNVADSAVRKALVEQTVEQFGGIDFLVANAGISIGDPNPLKVKEEEWDKMFDVNVKSNYFLIQEASKPMMKRVKDTNKDGSVIIMSSYIGIIPAMLPMPYTVTKTALLGMNKLYNEILLPQGIRVNALAPGYIDTKLVAGFRGTPIAKRVIDNCRRGRMGVPSEVSGVVSFLCSDDASYVSGETIQINGGSIGEI